MCDNDNDKPGQFNGTNLSESIDAGILLRNSLPEMSERAEKQNSRDPRRSLEIGKFGAQNRRRAETRDS